jgi:hypothetical protein
MLLDAVQITLLLAIAVPCLVVAQLWIRQAAR